jgi:thymidylate kinase
MRVNRPVVVAIEGPDAVGKSAQITRLVEQLKRVCPVGVATFTHAPPPQPQPTLMQRAVWYTTRRAVLGEALVSMTRGAAGVPMVVVADRWWWSTAHTAAVLQPALEGLTEAEAAAWRASTGIDIVTVMLDASDETLDARIAQRAADGAASAIDRDARQTKVRAAYRAEAAWRSWKVVRTDGDFDLASQQLLRAVLGELATGGYVRFEPRPAG